MIIGSPGTLLLGCVGAGLTVLGLLSNNVFSFFLFGSFVFPLRMLLGEGDAGRKDADREKEYR